MNGLLNRAVIFIGLAMVAVAGIAAVEVKAVTAQQRYPWNGLVDIVVAIQGNVDEVNETRCVFAATNCATLAKVPITSVTKVGDDSFSGGISTRRYVWNATNDVGAVKIDDLALTVDVVPLGGVQLWENGPYWAECNVGATKPEKYGYYFWWGDTVGYKRKGGTWTEDRDYTGVTWVSSAGMRMSSSPFTSCPTYDLNNSQLQSAGYIDSTGNLVAAYDAATVHLGAPWRMPTSVEIDALLSNCDTRWTTQGGVYGRLVTGRGAYASKSIFLPAAGSGAGSGLLDPGSYGEYWSSSPAPNYSGYAWYLNFDSRYAGRACYWYPRSIGHSIRPVRGSAK